MFESLVGFIIFLLTLIIGYFSISSDSSESGVSGGARGVVSNVVSSNVASDVVRTESRQSLPHTLTTHTVMQKIAPRYNNVHSMLADFINQYPQYPVVIIGEVKMDKLPPRQYYNIRISKSSASESANTVSHVDTTSAVYTNAASVESTDAVSTDILDSVRTVVGNVTTYTEFNPMIAESLPKCILCVINNKTSTDAEIVYGMTLQYLYSQYVEHVAALYTLQLPSYKQSRSEFNSYIRRKEVAEDLALAIEYDIDFVTNYYNACTCFYGGTAVRCGSMTYLIASDSTVIY